MTPARRALENPAMRSVARTGVKYALGGDTESVPYWLRWGLARAQAARRMRRLVRGTAIVWPEPGRALAMGRDLPTPGGGQVLIRAEASAVSPGTERAFFLRSRNTSATFPYFPGYSLAGEVVSATGEPPVRVGERVAAAAPHASLALVEASQVYRVPPGVSIEDAAFVQLGIIAINAIEQASIRPGDAAVVLGQGVIGQLLVQLAVAAGASAVGSVARTDRRVSEALRARAERVITLQRDGIEALEKFRPSVILDATGHPGAIPLALRVIEPGGTIVIAGSPREPCEEADLGELADKEVTIVGAHAGRLLQPAEAGSKRRAHGYAQRFFRLVAGQEVDLEPIISARVHPWEADWFYRRLARDEDAMIAAVFLWDRLEATDRMQRVSYLTGPDLAPLRRARKAGSPGRLVRDNRLSFAFMRGRLARTRGSPDEVLRIGLIGCGERGASYPRAIAAAGNARLAMVADVNADLARELGDRLGLRWGTKPEDLLESDDIDAILVCTPHHLHAAQAAEAARHHKHVMVEKPLATSLKDAVAAVEAARASNVCLSMLLQTRYQPHIRAARELIADGALGSLLGSTTIFQHDKLLGYWAGGYSGRSRSDWRARAETSGGGVLIHSAIHYLDWLGYLTGETIVEVSAEKATLDSPTEVEDTIAAWMRYANGAIGSLHAATCVRGNEPIGTVELWGTDGQVSLVPPHRFFSLRRVAGYRPGQWHQLPSAPSGGSDATEYFRRFAAAVLAGKQAEISAEAALQLQAVVEAFYESATAGKPVAVSQPP